MPQGRSLRLRGPTRSLLSRPTCEDTAVTAGGAEHSTDAAGGPAGDEDQSFDLHGATLRYPTAFRDGSSCMGVFTVQAGRAATLIADTPFEPAEVLPGRAVCSINCVHYTDTDCGAYEEIALALFVQPFGTRLTRRETLRRVASGDIASYTWRLGVTTALSRDAGIEMWGFPKQLAEIDYELGDGRASFTWSDGDDPVLRYETAARGKRSTEGVSPPVYSLIGGVPHVGYLTQSYRGVGIRPRGATLSLGRHPVADELRDLGVGKRPLLAVWNEHLTFEMSAPQRLDAKDVAGA